MKSKLTTTARIPALTLVAVLAAVGVGYAAIPGADGQIKGCYATSNGILLGCQWPSVSPQLRPSDLPSGGHVVSPLVAIGCPQRAVVAELRP
jgi:hypothetical protein